MQGSCEYHFLKSFGMTRQGNKPQVYRLRSRRSNHYAIASPCCFCCCFPDPFREMGAWQKTVEPQNLGNSPGSGPEVVEKQRVAKESAAQRVRNWTVQNEMRDVLGRVSTDAARRILDSANPREMRA